MSILEVHNVSIRYMTGDCKEIGIKEYVMRRLTGNYKVVEFWADRDVNFTLEEGEMLGIIGANGAGKSTLLKAVSGIMEPTKGYVRRRGTIAALLELGSGFDGDLTVRENTYLRGAMLGYTRRFMDEMYEQIIGFAELEEFQNRPFKQLSSGMKSRLAFAIASLVQPDILILDEVLSVGDGAFRKRARRRCGRSSAQGLPPSWCPTPLSRCGICVPRSSGSTKANRLPSARTWRPSAMSISSSWIRKLRWQKPKSFYILLEISKDYGQWAGAFWEPAHCPYIFEALTALEQMLSDRAVSR